MLRNAATAFSRTARRGFTSSSIARATKDPAWTAIEHGPQYRITEMKGRKAKFGGWTLAMVGVGMAVPFIAGEWIQYKMK